MNPNSDNNGFDRFLKERMNSGVPQDVEDRLRRHLDDLRQKMESAAAAEFGRRPVPFWRSWSRPFSYAISAASIGVLLMVLWSVLFGGGNGSNAYAEAVKKLRNAKSVAYTVTFQKESAVPFPQIDCLYRAPKHFRQVIDGGKGIMVYDFEQKKAVVLNPATKEYFELDLQEMLEMMQPAKFIEELRSLPEQASGDLGARELEGRTLHGYRVTEKGSDLTVWTDPKTGDLVRVEGEFYFSLGTPIALTNFRFDVEMDDALFALSPPPDFRRIMSPVSLGGGKEEDLLYLLRWWGTYHRSGQFPPSLAMADIAATIRDGERTGEFSRAGFPRTREERVKHGTQLAQGMLFALRMRPENDSHYAGKGVSFGQADKAIFWYKPSGRETYRVIYGDLTVRDMAPRDLPTAEAIPSKP